MRDNFPACLNVSLAYEGGWSDHPKDPGGATMKGVTLATFRKYYPNANKTALRNISTEQLQRIYRDGFWNPVNGDRLEAGVDLVTFDASVNSGPGRAKKWLLASIGGPAVDTVKAICAKRLGFMQSLKIWKTFGKGWARRVASVEAKGVAWALAAAHATPTVVEKLDEEAVDAKKKASTQTKSATTTGTATTAGGAVTQVDPATADQIGALLLGGLIVAGVLLTVYLVWRAHVNKVRAAAYENEAAGLP